MPVSQALPPHNKNVKKHCILLKFCLIWGYQVTKCSLDLEKEKKIPAGSSRSRDNSLPQHLNHVVNHSSWLPTQYSLHPVRSPRILTFLKHIVNSFACRDEKIKPLGGNLSDNRSILGEVYSKLRYFPSLPTNQKYLMVMTPVSLSRLRLHCFAICKVNVQRYNPISH